MSIRYHLGKDDVVVDALSRLSTCRTPCFYKDKKDLAKDVCIFARLGVWLSDFDEGWVMVINGVKSSLVSEVKEKQDQNLVLV